MKPFDFLLLAKRRLLPLLCTIVLYIVFSQAVFADPISFAAGIAGAGIFPVLPPGMSSQNFADSLDITTDWESDDIRINVQKNVKVDSKGTWHKITVSGEYLDNVKAAIDSFVGTYAIQSHMDKTLFTTSAKWGNVYFTEQLDADHYVYVLPVAYPGQTASINDVSWTVEESGNDVRYYFVTPLSSSRSGTFSPSLLNQYRVVLYLYSNVTDRPNVAIGNFAGSTIVWNQNYSAIIATMGSDSAGVSVGDIEDVSESEALSFLVLADNLPDSGDYTGDEADAVLEAVSAIPYDDTDDHEWEGVVPPVPPTPVPTSDPNTIGGAPVEDLWEQTGEIIQNQEQHKSIVERGITTITDGISQLISWLGRIFGIVEDTNSDINTGFDDVTDGLNDIQTKQDETKDSIDVIPPLIDGLENGLNDININVQEGNDSLEDISDSNDSILESVEGSKGILQDIKTGVISGVHDIVDAIEGTLEGILTAIEEGPVLLFKTGLDAIKVVFGELLNRLSGILGIWHYVVEWFNSISTPFTFFRNSAGDISYFLVLPVYACIAGGIVIAVYKRFGR